ncbi:MAG: hypothetical protein JNK89_07360, partial [Saprospiraceae bacterium]|nr:hypothetical protein [Saprospiraceae bacterium]
CMAQLMHTVKQFINFRYSAVKEGRVVRSGRKNNISQDPIALLNFARQQLALMRFYSERLVQHPPEVLREPAPKKSAEKSDKKRRVRRVENFFQSLYQELEDTFEAQQDFGGFEELEFSDYYYYRYLAEQEKAVHDSLHEWSARGGILNLFVASEKLDRFYLLSKLDQMCKLLHLQQMATPFPEGSDEHRRLKTNQSLTLKMAKLLIKNDYHLDDPAITLYFTLLQLLTKKRPEKTDQLAASFFAQLQQHRSLVPRKRFRDFNIIVRSYWARRYRQTRDRQFLELLFRSHQEDIDQLRRAGENIQSTHFQNTLFNAIKLGRLDWAQTFLDEFAPHITATPEPEIVADIGYAMLFFAQKNYKAAEKRLPHYFSYGATDDPTLYSLAATLDLRIRYELGALLDADSTNMRRATHKRIKENKSYRPERRDGILAFYELALRLFRQKEKLEFGPLHCAACAHELDEIRHSLSRQAVVDTEWLDEKCAELDALFKKKCPKTGSK